MKRRQFLTTSMLSAAAAALGPASAHSQSFSDTDFDKGKPMPYFTEEQMRQAMNVSGKPSQKRCFVVAYNFPAWHVSPVMEKWFGKGWTEYETLRDARTLFTGHQMPRQPLWGFYNEADPALQEREIDAASNYGIDAWMIDWYWHNGLQIYQEQLEQGFLKATNKQKLKFAIMWANHHWKNLYPASSPDDAATLLPQEHSQQDCVRMIDYCIKTYFQDPSYWRLHGGPVLGIFDLGLFTRLLTIDGAKRALDTMKERVRKAGLGELHVQASHSYGGHAARLRELGISSATQYHNYSATYDGGPPGRRIPFVDGALKAMKSWHETTEKVSVPFFPDCPVGWDDSPRFGTYSSVIVGRSPDQYERLLRAAQYFTSNQESPIIYLSAWNEWTEDHVLLPDQVYGYSYLEAVRRVFRG